MGIRALTGNSTFNIYPSGGKYTVAKINEDFDPITTLKSYRFQPFLKNHDEFHGTYYLQKNRKTIEFWR